MESPLTVEFGSLRIGLRSNRPEAADALRETFASHLVDDPDAPPNYSLWLADDAHTFHILYWGTCVAVRSLDPARVVSGLLDHLDSQSGASPGLARVHAMAVVREGVATLAPPTLRDFVPRISRRLAELGVGVVDAPYAWLDLAAGELVVGRRLVVHEEPLRKFLAAAPSPRRADDPVTPGRYPIRRWLFTDLWGEGSDGFSRAAATRRAAASVQLEDEIDPAERLTALGELFRSVLAIGIDTQSEADIVAVLSAKPATTGSPGATPHPAPGLGDRRGD